MTLIAGCATPIFARAIARRSSAAHSNMSDKVGNVPLSYSVLEGGANKVRGEKECDMDQKPYVWNAIPYLIRISVAKKDPLHKGNADPRYNGWREVWARCGIEQFDRKLPKRLREAYLKQSLDMADSLPMVALHKKGFDLSATDSMLTSSMYRYYGKGKNTVIRIGVEMILNPSVFW